MSTEVIFGMTEEQLEISILQMKIYKGEFCRTNHLQEILLQFYKKFYCPEEILQGEFIFQGRNYKIILFLGPEIGHRNPSGFCLKQTLGNLEYLILFLNVFI